MKVTKFRPTTKWVKQTTKPGKNKTFFVVPVAGDFSFSEARTQQLDRHRTPRGGREGSGAVLGAAACGQEGEWWQPWGSGQPKGRETGRKRAENEPACSAGAAAIEVPSPAPRSSRGQQGPGADPAWGAPTLWASTPRDTGERAGRPWVQCPKCATGQQELRPSCHFLQYSPKPWKTWAMRLWKCPCWSRASPGPTQIQSLALKMQQPFWGTKQRSMEYTIVTAYSQIIHYKVY